MTPTPDTRHPTPIYIELRCRSAFSFLAGASLPEDLIVRAADLGYPALALGDRDGVYGAPRFHHAAQRAGLRALIGTELTVGVGCGVSGARETSNTQHPTPHHRSLFLLAANRTGYQNLCQLITHSKLRAPKGESVTTWDDLDGRTDGLICIAGGADGPLAAAIVPSPVNTSANGGGLGRGPGRRVETLLTRLRALFPNRLYLDVQRHLDPDEERLNRTLIALAEHFRIPLVATNDVRHATPGGRPLLDVLTCIRNKTTLDAAGRQLLKNAERHLKPPAEMAALFRDLPAAIANTQRIAEQCEFTLADLGYRFPEYPVPPGETPSGYLRQLAYAGARQRYGSITARVRRQLEHELHIIGKLDLAGYFLIVWDIVRFCREQHILAQGRGSAANSAVCYALGITAVDAVGMELLFERFLSEERGEWPDIDIDLPSGDQRERVIQYVYQRYGERGAAMTANVITYRTRSAVREVGKALGFSLEQVDKLSKLLNRFEFRDDMDELSKQLRAGGVDPAAPRVRQLVALVQQIRTLPRHLGQHSGGMVIAAGRLDTVVPLEPASMPGRVVVQWDKDDCADLGIIKVDLLGLGMMAVLEETIPLIREHEGKDIDLAHLPPDDPQTYAMLRAADTIGVFQVESRAQMATLPRMRPDHFYDLVVEVAIIRPGPIVGQMVHPYLNRRNGCEPVTYAHPDLEPILKRTLGVPLFQEQLLRMAMTLAGFTGGEAEELRRAMGFKRSVERMQQIEARLRAGMAQRGMTGTAQDDIVRSITSFALYGFPESHAASFALLAYASAYLRAHHLAAFTCAMLNNWPLGFYHPATLVKDAQRHGLRVLPIDVTRSNWRCTLEHVDSRESTGESSFPSPVNTLRLGSGQASVNRGGQEGASLVLRLGLRYVTGLREEAAQRIAAAREQTPFTSTPDVITRCALRENEAQALAHLGAFAAFGLTRREALWQAAAVQKGELFAKVVAASDRGMKRASQNVQAGSLYHPVSPADQGASGRIGILPVPPERVLRQPLNSPAESLKSPLKGTPPPEGKRASSTLDSQLSTVDCPLPAMSPVDRTLADYANSGITIGPHVMKHLRDELTREGVLRAIDLRRARNGQWAKIAGLVIVRQRPGTAKGFCFITLEDETGTANAVVVPDMFQRYRSLIHTAALLLIEGPLQKTTAGVGGWVSGVGKKGSHTPHPTPDTHHPVIHVRARRMQALSLPQQPIGLTGSGYRMRVTPQDSQPNNQQPASFPKSHDFR
jgi:error-prone DNA polymerase